LAVTAPFALASRSCAPQADSTQDAPTPADRELLRL